MPHMVIVAVGQDHQCDLLQRNKGSQLCKKFFVRRHPGIHQNGRFAAIGAEEVAVDTPRVYGVNHALLCALHTVVSSPVSVSMT